MAERNLLSPNDPRAIQLDQYISILENRRSVIAELQFQQALSQLQDMNALQELQTLTNNLKQSTQDLQTLAGDLGRVQQVIQIVGSIVAVALPLIA
jgi:hypothetical protein